MAAGTGVVMALPHVGSWEWGGAWLDRHRLPDDGGGRAHRAAGALRLVHRPAPGDGAHDRAPRRRTRGRSCCGRCATGGLVGLLCDRDIVGNGVEVEFFGERTTFPAGPATLALRTGAMLDHRGRLQRPGPSATGRHLRRRSTPPAPGRCGPTWPGSPRRSPASSRAHPAGARAVAHVPAQVAERPQNGDLKSGLCDPRIPEGHAKCTKNVSPRFQSPRWLSRVAVCGRTPRRWPDGCDPLVGPHLRGGLMDHLGRVALPSGQDRRGVLAPIRARAKKCRSPWNVSHSMPAASTAGLSPDRSTQPSRRRPLRRGARPGRGRLRRRPGSGASGPQDRRSAHPVTGPTSVADGQRRHRADIGGNPAPSPPGGEPRPPLRYPPHPLALTPWRRWRGRTPPTLASRRRRRAEVLVGNIARHSPEVRSLSRLGEWRTRRTGRRKSQLDSPIEGKSECSSPRRPNRAQIESAS